MQRADTDRASQIAQAAQQAAKRKCFCTKPSFHDSTSVSPSRTVATFKPVRGAEELCFLLCKATGATDLRMLRSSVSAGLLAYAASDRTNQVSLASALRWLAARGIHISEFALAEAASDLGALMSRGIEVDRFAQGLCRLWAMKFHQGPEAATSSENLMSPKSNSHNSTSVEAAQPGPNVVRTAVVRHAVPEALPEGSWKTLEAAEVMPEKMGFCPPTAERQQEISATPYIPKLQLHAQTRSSHSGITSLSSRATWRPISGLVSPTSGSARRLESRLAGTRKVTFGWLREDGVELDKRNKPGVTKDWITVAMPNGTIVNTWHQQKDIPPFSSPEPIPQQEHFGRLTNSELDGWIGCATPTMVPRSAPAYVPRRIPPSSSLSRTKRSSQQSDRPSTAREAGHIHYHDPFLPKSPRSRSAWGVQESAWPQPISTMLHGELPDTIARSRPVTAGSQSTAKDPHIGWVGQRDRIFQNLYLARKVQVRSS